MSPTQYAPYTKSWCGTTTASELMSWGGSDRPLPKIWVHAACSFSRARRVLDLIMSHCRNKTVVLRSSPRSHVIRVVLAILKSAIYCCCLPLMTVSLARLGYQTDTAVTQKVCFQWKPMFINRTSCLKKYSEKNLQTLCPAISGPCLEFYHRGLHVLYMDFATD
jgi:hypothetical protein